MNKTNVYNVNNVNNSNKSPVLSTVKSVFSKLVFKQNPIEISSNESINYPNELNSSSKSTNINSETNVPVILKSHCKPSNIQNQLPKYSKLELEIISRLNSVEQLSSYSNLDLLMEIYSNKNLWGELYARVNAECTEDQSYQACMGTYSERYTDLVSNEPTIWFKFTYSHNISNGFEYKLGFNADTQSFKPFGSCNGGGLYFCKLEDLYQFKQYGKYLTPIVVPAGIPVYEEPGNSNYRKFKAPGIFMLPRIKIINEPAYRLVANASKPNNSAFGFLRWYNSNNPDELKMFLQNVNKNYLRNPFWEKEWALCKVKLDLIEPSNAISLELIHRFPLVLKSNRNKEFINLLINSVFPKIFSTNNFYMIGIHPVTVLNLDTCSFPNHIGQEYYNLIKRFRGVIAGSSVLEYITGIKLNPNDIDVYIGPDQLEPLESMLGIGLDSANANEVKSRGQFQFTLKTKPKEFEYFTWSPSELKVKVRVENKKNSSIDKQYNMNGIVKVYNLLIYNWLGNKIGEIQFICVDSDPVQFIKSNFDFDMCAIGFDTRREDFVNLIEKTNYRKLRITKSYISKMTGLEKDSWSNYRAIRTMGRIAKYTIRGFYVENWKDFLIEIRDKMCIVN